MSYKLGKTKFLGVRMIFKDGSSEIIKPHKEEVREVYPKCSSNNTKMNKLFKWYDCKDCHCQWM